MAVDEAQVDWWILGPGRGGLFCHNGDADAQEVGGSADLKEAPPSSGLRHRRNVVRPAANAHACVGMAKGAVPESANGVRTVLSHGRHEAIPEFGDVDGSLLIR
eukprot:1532064-Heterocapsa_arctica.AAC.1